MYFIRRGYWPGIHVSPCSYALVGFNCIGHLHPDALVCFISRNTEVEVLLRGGGGGGSVISFLMPLFVSFLETQRLRCFCGGGGELLAS